MMLLPSVILHLFMSTPPDENASLVLPPDWQLLIWFLLLVFVVAWLLLRSTSYSEAEAGALQHGEAHISVHDPVEPVGPVTTAERSSPVAVLDPLSPDDLTLIEGIGPKINSVMHAAGIHTFAQLAATEPAHLHEILLAEGLRLADPTSWPEQARLAAAGDWEAFNTLTAQLKGGRRA